MLELEEKVVASVARSSWIEGLAVRLQETLHHLYRGSERGRKTKDFLNGVWLTHPLHPAVTDVPIGAWTTAIVLEGLESITGRSMHRGTSAAIGLGIGAATLSAASGSADWADTYGEQRRIGMVHALANGLALMLFTASLWRRLSGRRAGANALSTAGFLSVLVGGYLGGNLTYRLGTHVNRNAWVSEPKQFTSAMKVEDLQPDRPTRATVQGVPILLVRRGETIYAMNEVCNHAGGPLSKGRLEDNSIVCPWHGSTYRLEDGTVVHGPSPYPQTHYEVRVREGQIEVCTEMG